MSNTHFGENLFHGRLRAVSGRLFWFGLAMIVLGLAAIVFPMVATLAAAVLVGWVLLVSGLLLFAAAFSIHGTGPFFGALLSGLLSAGAGVFLLHDPLVGAMILTLIAGIIFMLQGAFELVFAIEMRPSKGWLGMLISGAFSILIAFMIIDGWPSISAFVLGILLGVNFLTTGIGYIATSRAFRP